MRAGEMVHSDATDMMLSQRNHLGMRLQNYWDRGGIRYSSEEVLAQAEMLGDIPSGLCLNLSFHTEQARTLSGIRPGVVDNVDLAITTMGRPHVVLREDNNTAALPYRLLHEYSHVLDDVFEPYRPNDSDQYRKRLLRTELAAFATSVVAHEAASTQYSWWRRRMGYRSSATDIAIETIRRSINGDYTSPDAFDPNDEIEARILRKNLGYIYQQFQPLS